MYIYLFDAFTVYPWTYSKAINRILWKLYVNGSHPFVAIYSIKRRKNANNMTQTIIVNSLRLLKTIIIKL